MSAPSRSRSRPVAGIIVAGLCVLAALKLTLALRLPLFGDEAFYWLESRHLAPAFSDLPFLTALLVRAGTVLLGDTYAGVRLWFLVLGMLVPVLGWLLAERFTDRRAAWWAAGATGCVPLAAMLGVLALPDVPLVVLALAGLLALVRATDGRGRGWWIAAGGLAALGFCAHYRFAALMIGPALWFVATPAGRRWLGTPWPWVTAVMACGGLAPVLWFNLHHEFAGLAFQFVDRHPWRFQPEGWKYLPVQALVTTPIVFAALVASFLAAVRAARRDEGVGLVLYFSAVPVIGFALAAFFADAERTSAHWPLAAYLPILAWFPGVLASLPRGWRYLPPLTGIAGTLLMAGYLVVAIRPDTLGEYVGTKAFPDNFAGWPSAAGAARAQRNAGPGVLVGGNFMLAAELDFELQEADRVYSLDHPLNGRHGRQRQLSIWGLDEAGLARREPGRRALIVIEETALKIGDRPAWVRRLCRLFDRVEYREEVVIGAGRQRFLYFTGRVRPETGPPPRTALPRADCDLPPHAYLIEPARDDAIRGTTRVYGWAVEDNAGVASVTLLVEGREVAATGRFYRYPDVAEFLPGSVDPNHPEVGFEMQWDTSDLEPGRYDIAIRVTTRDGNVRVLENREVVVER